MTFLEVLAGQPIIRVCLHEMLQADWSMRGPIQVSLSRDLRSF